MTQHAFWFWIQVTAYRYTG